MPRLRVVLEEARKLGGQHGSAAAGWYFDDCRDLQREDYLKVIKGIQDGDPAILDTFVSADLSGQYADGMTPKRLFEEVGANKWQSENAGDEICETYEQAFNDVYAACVEQNCRELLRRTVTFVIDVDVEEQDVAKILSDMEEVAAKANCDLIEAKAVDIVGERIEA